MTIPESSIAQVTTGGKGIFRRIQLEQHEKQLHRSFESPQLTRLGAARIFRRKQEGQKVEIQRNGFGQPEVSSNTNSEIQGSLTAGTPLPQGVRQFMEPRFRTDFNSVRVHTNDKSATLNRQLNAQAFTMGKNIFFGENKFRPENTEGKELIAHELTHTIQQGAVAVGDAVHRSPEVSVTEHSGQQVQRLFGLPSPREFLANKASAIPGFTMLTVVVGYNPITNARVERTAGNILRGAIELIPGGSIITDALNNHGVFDKVSIWASQQFDALKDIGSSIRQDIEQFINNFSITDLGGAWDRAKLIVTRPIDRIIAFAKGLKNGIVAFIKDVILKPIAALAKANIPNGYDLLCAVMGRDPISGEAVAQSAENLISPFMKLIGQEEVWTNMKKANAIPRAWAWFQKALTAVKAFVQEIPTLFVNAFKALEVIDIVLVPRAFAKLVGVFGGFVGRFINWAGGAVWNLLEIIFDVVSPGALAYIKKTGSALKSILANPLPFVGNLVKAAKLGFTNFADNFATHLKTGLIDWLTGSLPGIYIPKAFSLQEIVKFVFSVLGLTWQNIRAKLVKLLGETAVKAMETGFDIVVTLVTQGPAAAWEKIKEQLANLKDMVIGGITDFVIGMVVQKAVPKLIAMFIPGAGFISAILSIYDTIMVFVNKIKQIVQVVKGFVDSIVAIAGGAIGAAAARVESSLATGLSLAINFLAGFIGLGKVADKVMGVIEKIRAPIDKALDWLVNWIVTMARNFLSRILGGNPNAPPQERLANGMDAAVAAVNRLSGNAVGQLMLKPLLFGIKTQHKLQSLEAVAEGGRWVVEGSVNPRARRATTKLVAEGTGVGNFQTRITYYSPDVRRGGKRMVADPLGPDHPLGTAPSSAGAPAIWAAVNERRNGRRLYVLGHLLNMRLGGSGDTASNLTPITFSANATHEAQAERGLKARVNNDKKWVFYEVAVNYPSSRQSTPPNVEPDEGWLATSFTAKWQSLEPKPDNPNELERKGSVESVTVQNVGGGNFPQT